MNTTTTILLCGFTNNGNVAATNEAKTERYILAKTGEILTGSHLQFPDHILQDRVTSTEEFPTVEAMIRQYFEQKTAAERKAKAESEKLEARASMELIRRFGSLAAAAQGATNYRNLLMKKDKYVEPTVKALKAALKKAEAAAEKEKELQAWKKKVEKAFATLPSRPEFPLTGTGCRRNEADFSRQTLKGRTLWDLLPSSHKDYGSSYRPWCVSLEASAVISKFKLLA